MALLIVTIIGLCKLVCVFGALIVKPQNFTVNVWSSVRFSCITNTSEKGINWKFGFDKDTAENIYIYSKTETRLVEKYRRLARYEINIDMNKGRFDLIIRDVVSKDAGVYSCEESSDHNNTEYAVLTVIGLQQKEEKDVCDKGVVAYVGEDIELVYSDCLIQPFIFYRIPFNGSSEEKLFEGEQVLYDFLIAQKISVSRYFGILKVTIYNIQVADAGAYFCLEAQGGSRRKEVTVANFPRIRKCMNNIGNRDYNHAKEAEVDITCFTEYSGRCAPEFEWEYKDSSGDVIERDSHFVVIKTDIGVESVLSTSLDNEISIYCKVKTKIIPSVLVHGCIKLPNQELLLAQEERDKALLERKPNFTEKVIFVVSTVITFIITSILGILFVVVYKKLRSYRRLPMQQPQLLTLREEREDFIDLK